MELATYTRTFDGALHESPIEAKRHLEHLYGCKLSALAHQLVKCDGKYLAFCAWLDSSLPDLEALLAIKADMKLADDSAEE